MKTVLSLFPTALIAVHKSEKKDYVPHVPKGQLLTHDVTTNLIDIRNWIYTKVKSDCVVQFNDDVYCAIAIGGKRMKKIRNPRDIKQIIDNAVNCANDLGIGLFCWTLSINKSFLHPECKPFRPVMRASAHAWGILGSARERRMNNQFVGMGDFDYTLECLLHDRILLGDARFSFLCGRMSEGKGGQTGRLRNDEFLAARKALSEKWGKHAAESAQKKMQKSETYRSFSVNVKRSNPMATR